MRRIAAFTLALVFATTGSWAQPRSADALVSDARVEAANSGRTVFVGFTASWCGWCKLMHKVLHEEKTAKIWDRHFVTVWLDVLERDEKKAEENPGGTAWYEKLNGKEQGIPFFAFLDSEGNPVTDSRRPIEGKPASNVGCPVSREEVDWFLTMIKKVRTDMAAADLKVIEESFLGADKRKG